MSRQPAFREEILLTPCSGGPRERILLIDLARFLGADRVRMVKLAKKLGLYHPGAIQRERSWVTAHGARRLIAYIRALQQHRFEQGKRGFSRSILDRAYKAKKLAIRRAGTDAEPQLRGQLKGGG